MKIAIYSTSIEGGGSERFATVLASGMVERGYEVHLLTCKPKEGEYTFNPKVIRKVLHTKMSFLSNVKALYRYLKAYSIDTCVAVGIYPNLVAATVNLLGSKTHIVLSERNAPKQDHLSLKSKILRALLYRFGDSFHFQTPDAKDYYSKSIQNRSVVIANPLKEGLPIRGGKHNKQIVAVGRLMLQKNYRMLLEAFAGVCLKNSDYTLHIYGKGMLMDELKSYACSLGISNRVFFEGFVLDVHNRIKDADIYVMSSDFEGLPNALMEAMAMGFPVVSTDCPCGGPRMIIQDGVNGLLTPVGDVQAMAAALLRLIDNPEEKEAIASCASEAALNYSVDNIMTCWEEFLTK